MTSKIKILLVALFVVTLSCDKEEKSIVDCFTESFLLDVHHSRSSENPQQVNLNVSYAGDYQLGSSVKWNFGDGTPVQTITGTTTSHTYAANGNYTVTATVTLRNGSCSYDLKETVNLQ